MWSVGESWVGFLGGREGLFSLVEVKVSPGCFVGGGAFLDGRLVGESPGCIGEMEGGESPGSSVWLRGGGGEQVYKTLA